MSDTNKHKYFDPKLTKLFNDNHEYMEQYRIEKEQAHKRRQEGIEWLVKHGVDRNLIARLIKHNKLTIATLDEAKREYVRLIEMCDLWESVRDLFDDDDDQIQLVLSTLKTLRKEGVINDDKLNKQIRYLISNSKNMYTEDDLMKLIKNTFGKDFKFEWVRNYTRKTGKTVDTYVRIQFKNAIQ